jgi:hypothetical protein
VTEPQDALAVYRETVIKITLPDGSKIETSPGSRPPDALAPLLPTFVITAWNPGEQRPPEPENRRAQADMRVRLEGWNGDAQPLTLLEAVGRSRDGRHAEPSIAVHGMSQHEAVLLAKRMEQWAIFAIDEPAVEVVPCRGPLSLSDARITARDALADVGSRDYRQCFLAGRRYEIQARIARLRANHPHWGIAARLEAALTTGAPLLLNGDDDYDVDAAIDVWRDWCTALLDLAAFVRERDPDSGPSAEIDAAIAAASRSRDETNAAARALRGPTFRQAAPAVCALVRALLNRETDAGRPLPTVAAEFRDAAAVGLKHWHAAHVHSLGHELADASQPTRPATRANRPPSAAAGPTLLYGYSEDDLLLVAPAELVADVRATRSVLRRARTWGAARSRLSSERFAELRAMLVAESAPDPAERAPLDLGHLQPWPALSWGSMPDYLPESLIATAGSRVATMLSSGVRIERDDASAAIAMLRRAGIHCKYDGRLQDLFSAWD